MGSYSVDESVLDLPTLNYSYSSAVTEGYASTDESANSDALSNPVLPDRVKEIGWVLCLLIPFLSVGGLSSVAAGGLRLSSSIAADSVSVEDSIHEE